NPRGSRTPGPIGEHRESGVTGYSERDASQVHEARIDSIGERDEERHGHGVRGIEQPRDPTCLAIRDLPVSDESGEERRPWVGPDLSADLRDADQSHEAGRSHPPRVRAWALQAPPRFKRRPSRFARATGAAPD